VHLAKHYAVPRKDTTQVERKVITDLITSARHFRVIDVHPGGTYIPITAIPESTPQRRFASELS
jgi:hypothetical protein